MKVKFNYIRNRIGEYKKDDLLEFSYKVLKNNKYDEKERFPIWFIFILMKWTYIYGEKRYPSKILTEEKFTKIYKAISNFNQEHISNFIKNKEISKAFQILHNQQFYLQKTVYNEIIATQLKLFTKLKSRYDISLSFKEKTGFSIFDFLFITQIVWLYVNIDKLGKKGLYFDGYLDDNFLNLTANITSVENVKNYLLLLLLNPNKTEESINNFRYGMRKEDLQAMEISFFTMFPFQVFKGRIRLIHPSIFKYTINHYIYDYMKNVDENFTTELGHRLEKYIELGLKEINISYKTEKEIKKILPAKSKLVDFVIGEESIYIESKATEMQAYPSVNPLDKLIYNSLKSSIFKAYFEQLTSVSKKMSPQKENWGIIITYKEFFWSSFAKLYEIGKSKYSISIDNSHLPPENVFIVDIYTWDKVIQIIKNGKASLLEILKKVKDNNSKPSTSKQLFSMHLEEYDIRELNLSYLQEELSSLKIEKK